MEPKYWWTIIGIAGFIIEIFSPGFFAGSLGIGAFCAAGVSLFTDAIEYQLADPFGKDTCLRLMKLSRMPMLLLARKVL